MAKGQTPKQKPRLVDQQNRVALPQEVLDHLQVGAGDFVIFTIDGKNVCVHKAKWVVDD